MWIRSQYRKMLVKVTSVYIYGKLDGTFMIRGLNECCVGYQDDDFFNLGTYGTEERALEVLDEIQESIARDVFYRTEDCIRAVNTLIDDTPSFLNEMQNGLIYQMPKE